MNVQQGRGSPATRQEPIRGVASFPPPSAPKTPLRAAFFSGALLLAFCGAPGAATTPPEVWKCVVPGGKPYYTNQEEETKGKTCTKVKREVSVVPTARLAREAKGKLPPSLTTPRTAPPELEEGRIERRFGSGIVVSANGDVLTNAHLINECTGVRVRGGGEDNFNAAVVAMDQDHDLAVIRTERPWGEPASLRADAPLRAGESVWALGYPLTGLLAPELNITQGIVSAAAGVRGDPQKVQITNPIQTGNSGGPLLDQAGNVVGVVSGKLNALKVAQITGELPQNVNFAIKVEAVTRFLSAARVSFLRSSVRVPVEGVDLVRDARKYTVLIECQT